MDKLLEGKIIISSLLEDRPASKAEALCLLNHWAKTNPQDLALTLVNLCSKQVIRFSDKELDKALMK